MSYNLKASFNSACIASTSSGSSSVRNPAANVTNSSNSNCPDPKKNQFDQLYTV